MEFVVIVVTVVWDVITLSFTWRRKFSYFFFYPINPISKPTSSSFFHIFFSFLLHVREIFMPLLFSSCWKTGSRRNFFFLLFGICATCRWLWLCDSLLRPLLLPFSILLLSFRCDAQFLMALIRWEFFVYMHDIVFLLDLDF